MAKNPGSTKGKIENIVISVKATNVEKVTTSLSSLKTILSSVQTSITTITPKLLVMGTNMSKLSTDIQALGSSAADNNKKLSKLANTLTKVAKAATDLNGVGGLEKTFSGSGLGAAMAEDVASSFSSLNTQAKATNATLSALLETSETTNKYLYIMAANLESVAESSEDSTTSLDKLNRTLGTTGKKTKQAEDGLNGLTNKTRNQARANSNLLFSAGGLVAMYASWAATIYTLAQGFDYLKRSADLTRLEKSLGALARRGQDLRGLSETIREVSAGSLSQEESIRTATKAVTYGFSSEELKEFTIQARKASIALGRDMVESLDRLTLGIAKGEIELLDELGIVTRLDTAYRKYATSIGKTAQQLTETERRAAITTEALSQLQEAYSGINAESNIYEKTLANIKDASRELGQLIAESDIAIGGMNVINFMAENIKKAVSQQRRFNIALQIAADLQNARTKVESDQRSGKKNFQAVDAQLNLLGKTSQAEKEQIALASDREKKVARLRKLEEEIFTIRQTTNLTQPLGGGSALYGGDYGAQESIDQYEDLRAKMYEATVEAKNLREAIEAIDAERAASAKELKQVMPEVAYMSPEEKENTRVDYEKRKKVALDSENAFSTAYGNIMKNRGNRYNDMYTNLKNQYESLDGLNGRFSILHETVAKNFLEVAKSFNMEAAFKQAGGDPRWLFNYIKEQGDLLDDMGHRLGLSNARISGSLTSQAEQAAAVVSAYKDYAAQITIVDSHTKRSMEQTAEQLQLDADLASATEALDLSLSKLNSTYNIKAMFEKDEIARLKIIEKGLQAAIDKQIAAGASTKYLATQILELKEAQASVKLAEQARKEAIELENINALYAMKAVFLEDSIALADNEVKAQEARVALMKDHKSDGLQIIMAENQLNLLVLQANKAYSDRLETLKKINEETKRSIEKAQGERRGDDKVTQLERDIKYANEDLANESDKVERARLEGRIKVLQDELSAAKMEKASKIGGSDGLTSIFGNESLANVGYQASQGNQEAVNQQAATNLASIKDELQSINPAMGEVTSGVESLGQSFYQMGKLAEGGMLNAQSAAQGVSASIQAVSGILGGLSQQNIDGIEAEIAIEKKRDGKSKESMEKIKKLENQKLKEMQKAKMQQAVMATAAGIAESLSLPWPYNFIQAGIVAAMGAAQIAAIRSSGKSEAALLNTEQGGNSMSLTVGKRENSVDVAKSANVGELAYSHGVSGTGTGMGNYTPTPRSSASDMSAGTTYLAGDRGPELIRLGGSGATMDKTNTSGSSLSIPIQINASAIDARGLEDKIKEIVPFMVESIETRLNGKGYTLYKKT